MNEMEELEDFHYQNHTDRPDNISEEDWDGRYRVWSELTENWRLVLVLPICNTKCFYQIDPWMELSRKIIDENTR